MYNDFIIVGPDNDPHDIRKEKNIKDVFKTIKEKTLLFLTRGDNSGTHKREIFLWNHSGINTENIEKQMSLIKKSKRPVLAYCTSGTRCAVIWALGQTGKMPKDEILKATLECGYNLEGLL